jgi:vacuolar-type H+-ATPase subunit I/STV1
LIWFPVFFTLIYGEFGRAAVVLFIGSGMLRLLENNLPLPAYRKKGIDLPDRPAVVIDGEDVALGKSSEV